MPPSPSLPATRRIEGFLLVAVVLVALNLRGPLVGLPTVSAELQDGLLVGASAVGLLTSIPVLCFGLASPLASGLIARVGLRWCVVLAMAGVLVGCLLRSASGYPVALAGTVVLGLAITIGNIALPVIIGEDFPAAVGLVTAVYTAALNLGSTLTSSVTPVLSDVVGWRWALASSAVLALVAGLGWWAASRRVVRRRAAAGTPSARSTGAGTAEDGAAATSSDGVAHDRSGPEGAGAGTAGAEPEVRRPVWRRASSWGLTAAFTGQAFSYYGTTAWLPSLLADELGVTAARAGVSASIFQVCAVVGAFGVPALLRLTGRPQVGLVVVCLGWAALPVGMLLAPQLWALWCAVAGAAQGGGITVLFVAIVARTRGAVEARQLSALVQGVGYVVAATGPFLVGAVHDATGGWDVPLLVVLAAITLMLVAGLPAVGRRTAEAARPA